MTNKKTESVEEFIKRKSSSSEKLYTKEYGDEKIGKLWLYAKDLIESGKRPLLPAESFYLNWNGTTNVYHP